MSPLPTSPRQTLREAIAAYIGRQCDLSALEDALSDLAVPVSEARDSQAEQLSGLAWLLLSEFDQGHRSEESVREELARAVAESPPAERARL